ncbi:MAG: hypothetical protein CSA09_01070 [Candidatus Contendobacter odensis]|uniref:DUF4398 domain-containing protein n=1 Tax=Candidatus Contendibacter odensensis TaxID=1400860 RepID=A0A2G6PGG5_9GAMM|nr:MAG: hypothetical protein CSA09_01070 [Candidatus Contendobacter odensis]
MALVLTACVTIPVQEMSDARQAIRAAETVGAAQYSPHALIAAHQLLLEAQQKLEASDFNSARRHAKDARDQAIKARKQALKAVQSRQLHALPRKSARPDQLHRARTPPQPDVSP